ncbi:ATP-binding cassette domain-containing protein [Bryobacter aggregatus]|uniref:ATP-binding cassette domain-containing protein n=1 Tax=Bryobacter aggregatus TaxID=360054 RepID=UPI0004E1D655|nr:ATP-binding cassette domain-containing protein [Bryobacter aggregatus]
MSSPTKAIDINGLRFAYGKDRPNVLDIPRFELNNGESCFLHGPSGCGKTTLLGIIAGVLKGTGDVQVLGNTLSQCSGAQRDAWRGANIGYIFQMFNLIPYLSVRDNILLPCRLHKARRDKEAPEAACRRLAAALDIEGLLDRGVLELSVGQQQRVAAARALIGTPALVIADEPTSALDTAHRESFLQLLRSQCSLAGSALLFVSHDQSIANLFDRRQSLPELNLAAQRRGA